MRIVALILLSIFLTACGTTPAPRPVEKVVTKAVMVEDSLFELKDVAAPMPKEDYLKLTEEEMAVEDGTLIQKLYGDIKILRLQVRSIYKAMLVNKQKLESENK